MPIERGTLKKFTHPSSFLAPVRRRESIYELFHENTKLTRLTARFSQIAVQTFLSSRNIREVLNRAFKVYSLADRVELERPEPRNSLENVIAARRSARRFTGESATIEELSRLLFFSYGKVQQGDYPLRMVASGGALYPLEIYVVALRVEGLDPGIYHYNIEDHGLEVLERCDGLEMVKERILVREIDVDNAAMVLLITGVFRRNTIKYLDRGYRMILFEAGEVAHNMNLMATSIGLGGCLVGGFYDDELSAALGIDGIDEAPLLPLVLGRPVRD